MAVNKSAVQAQRIELERPLIQLHLGEYQALTTRATYNEAFCTALWGVVMGYLTLMATIWPHINNKVMFAWISLMAVETMFIWIAGFLLDEYLIVLYIETSLAPSVAIELGEKQEFWLWEKFLKKRRGHTLPLVWEWGMTALVLIGMVSLLIWRVKTNAYLSNWDWLGLPSFGLLLLLAKLARAITAARIEWSRKIDPLEKQKRAASAS
jgi:hypothetical protein